MIDTTSHMINTTQFKVDCVIDQLTGKKEELIKAAITHALGRDDWTMDEVRGRGLLEQYPNMNTMFFFDGVPMISFHPLDSATLQDSPGGQLKLILEYKLLYTE